MDTRNLPGAAPRTPAYLVFSDVDETLIRCKSMFDFLRFRLVRRDGPEAGVARYEEIHRRLRALAEGGAPREGINAAYYRHYAGESAAELAQLGREWFAERSREPGFFITDTLWSLRRHLAAGAHLVLVSGSFPVCTEPVARAVGAAALLCTTPLAANGTYTGEITQPVIGDGKRDAVLKYLAKFPEIDPRDCFGYGDHLSDLPMLECVGNPRVVGGDPELLGALSRAVRPQPGYAVASWSMGAPAHEC
jgi:HAD superfamily hydrolase (TIGR01490 family)